MTTSVNGENAVQSLQDVFDYVSMNYGNQDGLTLCGTRTSEVINYEEQHKKYLTLIDNTLTVQSTDNADIGEHEIVIKVFLTDYPQVSKQAMFKLTINPCIITEFTGVVKPAKLNYQIGAPSLNSFKMTFTQLASCGYKENIQIVTDLPDFVTFNEETNDFTIVSDEGTHDGIFPLTVNATIEVP